MNIGPNIRRFRKERGMTLVELARRLETHPSNVRRWEVSRVSPRWETVVRIAEALEVPVEDLAGGEDTTLRLSGATPHRSQMLFDERPVPDQIREAGMLMDATPEEEAIEGTLHAQTTRMADQHEARAREYRALSRFLRHPRFRVLREAIAALPEDLTQEEVRRLADVLREEVARREGKGDV